MAKQKPMKWTANIVRGDEVIPYETLTEEEKNESRIRMSRRPIEAVERSRGNEVTWLDPPPDTVTA
jgi:hypothetical protein